MHRTVGIIFQKGVQKIRGEHVNTWFTKSPIFVHIQVKKMSMLGYVSGRKRANYVHVVFECPLWSHPYITSAHCWAFSDPPTHFV